MDTVLALVQYWITSCVAALVAFLRLHSTLDSIHSFMTGLACEADVVHRKGLTAGWDLDHLHLQLVFMVMQMGLVKGFFALFPKEKVRR